MKIIKLLESKYNLSKSIAWYIFIFGLVWVGMFIGLLIWIPIIGDNRLWIAVILHISVLPATIWGLKMSYKYIKKDKGE